MVHRPWTFSIPTRATSDAYAGKTRNVIGEVAVECSREIGECGHHLGDKMGFCSSLVSWTWTRQGIAAMAECTASCALAKVGLECGREFLKPDNALKGASSGISRLGSARERMCQRGRVLDD